jgi:hypothetical protein
MGVEQPLLGMFLKLTRIHFYVGMRIYWVDIVFFLLDFRGYHFSRYS